MTEGPKKTLQGNKNRMDTFATQVQFENNRAIHYSCHNERKKPTRLEEFNGARLPDKGVLKPLTRPQLMMIGKASIRDTLPLDQEVTWPEDRG